MRTLGNPDCNAALRAMLNAASRARGEKDLLYDGMDTYIERLILEFYSKKRDNFHRKCDQNIL